MASNFAETIENEQILPRNSYLDEAKKENPCLPLASLNLLNKYGKRMKQFGRAKLNRRSYETTSSSSECRQVSVVGIIKLARMRLLQSKSDKYNTIDSYLDNLSVFNHPSGVHSTSSHANIDVVEFVLCLLVAAEKFSIQQFDLAKKLLSHCAYFASAAGTPVQKVVHYFSKALDERIDIEKGYIDLERKIVDENEAFMNLHPAIFVSEQAFPNIQAAQFTGIQAILDNMASSKRIHLIDFQIRSGIHWTILMQSLATRNSCSLEQLKITAVGTSKDDLEITGRWLSSFAESLNLPFLFKILLLEMNDVQKDELELELEPDETVAVYFELVLWSLLASPQSLDSLMEVLKNLNPRIMVMIEMETNTDTSIFLERFHEALSLCAAEFDCLEACLEQDLQFRKIIEEAYFEKMIRNIDTTEDEERVYRHVRTDSWREIFSKFGVVEIELSNSSLIQARLLLNRFPCRNYCSLNMNGKCMILEWKVIEKHKKLYIQSNKFLILIKETLDPSPC